MPDPGYPRNESALERIGRALGFRQTIDGPTVIDPRPPTDPPDDDHDASWRNAKETPTRKGGARGIPFSTEPPPRGNEPPFIGEEARADETPKPQPPGEPTGMTVPGQDYPTNTAGPVGPLETKPPTGGGGRGGGGGGGKGAIDTDAWKNLGDQTRDKAFDYQKDMYDPRNVHATAADGRVNLFGPNGENNQPNEMTTPIKAGVSWLHRMFHQDQRDQHTDRGHQAMVTDNVGAPDPHVVDQVFKTVDPNGELPMNRRVELSIRALHDFYMAQANEATDPQQKAALIEKAGKSAGEMMQFSVKMSKVHGQEAMKALQAGRMDDAMHQLQAGYGWLGDGHHSEVVNGQIHIVDQNGKTTDVVPMEPKYIRNLALGMASGEFGHDVYRSRAEAGAPAPGPQQAAAPPAGGAPPGPATPPSSAPAAQPPAAPAGPQTPPPAAPTATASGSASAYNDTHGGPQGGAPAAPTVNIGDLTKGSTGQSNQVLQTTPPMMPGQAPAAPTPAPPTPPTTPTTPPAPVTPPSKPETSPVETKPAETKPAEPKERSQKELDDEEKKAFAPPANRAPFHRYKTDETNATVDLTIAGRAPVTMSLPQAQTEVQNYYKAMNDSILKDTVGKPKARAGLLQALKMQHADLMKQIGEARTRANAEEDKSKQVELKYLEPHVPGESERQLIAGGFKSYVEQQAKTEDPISKAAWQQSPMRYMDTEEKRAPMDALAYSIYTHNHNQNLSPAEAYKLAVGITRFVPDTQPPEKGEKEGKPTDPKKVPNGYVGRNGAYFRVVNRDAANQVVIRTDSGKTISLDPDAFQAALEMRKSNYDDAKAHEAKEKKLQADREKLGKSVLGRFGTRNPLLALP